MTSNVNLGNNNGMPMRGGSSNSNGNGGGNVGHGDGNGNSTLQNELELLLLQQQQQQQNRRMLLEREMELNINRSGSAPPTVDGALRAAGNLFKNPSFERFDDIARGPGGNNNNASSLGFLTEEEIRSHPAYLEYYYSNENLNPRLPPPLFSKEDWRVAQRFRAAGLSLDGSGDWRDKSSSFDNDVRSSLFSMQPGLSVKKSEDDLVELRKAALRNISRKNSTEFLDRGSIGLGGGSSSGMGGRRKSFADILQEGLGRPKSNLSRPASQNSIGDIMYSTGANAADIQNRTQSMPEKAFTSLSSSQNISSTSNARSSGIFEVADIADSLSSLSVSKNQLHAEDILKSTLQMKMAAHKYNSQQHYFEKSRADQLVDNIAYAQLHKNNGSSLGLNSLTNDQMSSPRRTSSPSNHHPQLNPSDYVSREDLKMFCQGNSYPAGMDVSSHGRSGYQKPDMMFNNDLIAASLLGCATGDGHNPRGGSRAGMHFPVMDPDQYHYLRVPGTSSPGRYVGSLHGFEDFQALEKAYLEALLMQQNQQYLSQFLHKPSNINHQYHGNPSYGPSYQGNVKMDSFQSAARSGSPVLQNEKSAQFSPTDKSIKGESSGSSQSQTGNNMKGRCETLLEVVKNNKIKSLELSDVLNHVVEFSTDQYGSRFIQQKLETATVEEKMKIFTEITPHARTLMIDVFGNYVIQKFFEHGTENQRKELAMHLIGHVLPLSLQMYGCRVIQKALEVVDVELQTQMVAELDGSVMKCVRDQNGNHVIQKCIECVPQDRIQFIISSFVGQVVALSTHPYGCRVIQRVLEHCVDQKTQTTIMEEIMSCVCNLAQDQYGNYVLQHVLQHGKPHERSAIISKLAGQIVQMSQQKFASNVIEKCLTFGGPDERKLLVNEMLGSTPENEPLQAMMKDPFGNYVVQKVIETCDDRSRELILSRIKVHLTALKRYTYGKHIVSRVEKLVAAGEKHKGQSSSNSS